MNIRGKLCIVGVACAAMCANVEAQATFGNVIGTVTDPSGAAVANAKVTLTSQDRGTVLSVLTNESGNFTQTHLSTGTYRVEIEAPGFQRYVQDNVIVSVDRSTRLDAQLAVGQVTEEVNVTANPATLVTDRAEVSTSLNTQMLGQLPIFDRNLTQVQLMLPGAQKMPWQHASSENPQGGIQINNNGQDFGSTNFTIDGMDNNDPVLGIIVINPTIDSVKELKYATGNFDAEYAQAGGAVIQVETKSGTNEYHGSLFEYLRNDVMNARNPFSEPKGPPPLRWNQFGGSLGGPIVKNKLFAFGDYQGTRRRTGASLLTTVPTAAMHTGDFSAFSTPIFDPATGDVNGNGRTQFAGNVIPAGRISSQARNLLDLMPLPNTGAPGAVNNNFAASGSEQFDTNQFDIRVDHNLTDKVRYFGRYSYGGFFKLSPPAFGARAGGPALSGLGFAGKSETRNQNAVGTVTYVVNPTLLSDFRFGYSRYRVNVLPLDFGSNTGEQVGIPNTNLPNRPDTSGIPSFVIQGNGGFREGYSLDVNQCNCPLNEREFVFQMVNNWTKVSGNHTFKWGADVRRAQNLRLPSDLRRNGNFVFNESVTGSAAVTPSGLAPASFLLGLPSQLRRFAQNATDAEDAQWRMFYFGQDTWRVTPKLTLSLGLRWDTWFPNFSINAGQGSRYDVTNNTIFVAGVGGNGKAAGVRTQWTNLSPRVAIAYTLTSRTVIRTGWGRSYYEEIFGWNFNYIANNYPTLIEQFVPQPTLFTAPFTLASGPPQVVFPEVPPNGQLQLPDQVRVNYRPRDLKFPYVDSWNFSIEQLLTGDTTATVSYVGNAGRHVRQIIPLNQAIPGPGPLNPRRPLFAKFGLTQDIGDQSLGGSNNYNALQTKVQKRFSRNLSFLGSYTWSKAIDNPNDVINGGRLQRGIADFSRAHVFTFGQTVQLPFGRGHALFSNAGPVVRQLVEGWEFSGLTLLQSGLPFSPSLSNTASLNANAPLRPDRIASADPFNVPGGQNRDQWFNPGAYSVPAPFQFGNAGRNSLRGPGLFEADWALNKRFNLNEQRAFQLRWEVYNVFNRTNLANPNGAIDAGPGNTGVITGTAAPMRQMQVGLRFDF